MGAGVESPRYWMLGDGCKGWASPSVSAGASSALAGWGVSQAELELELILSHMTQKPMLRGEVGARALRVRSDVRGHGQVRLCFICLCIFQLVRPISVKSAADIGSLPLDLGHSIWK